MSPQALFVPESPIRTRGRISGVPVLLLSAWLVALLVALSQAPVWGWGSFKIVTQVLVSIVMVVAGVLVESRPAALLIDMQMMRMPAV